MKIRRKSCPSEMIEAKRFGFDWMVRYADGYRVFDSQDWEEVPTERWVPVDVKDCRIELPNYSHGGLYDKDGDAILHVPQPGTYRLTITEGWVQVSEIGEAIAHRSQYDREWVGDLLEAYQRPMLQVERKGEES